MSNKLFTAGRLSRKEKISSIRNQPIEKHINNIVVMRDSLSNIILIMAKDLRRPFDDAYRMTDWFNETIQLLKKLQLDILNDRQVIKIFYLIYSYLPEGGDIFIQNYSHNRGGFISLGVAKNGKGYNYFSFLKKLVQEQQAAASKASFISQIQKITPPSAAPVGYTKNVNPHAFPNINVNEPLISSSIAKVKKLWLEASGTTNVVETEFFLEQTVLVYIPESYNLYLNFKNADKDSQQKAANSFVEQMNLIQGKLSTIIESKRENDMRAVETQTVFLRDSLGAPALNSLEKVKSNV